MFHAYKIGQLLLEENKMEAGDLFTFILFTGVLGGAIASFGTLYTQVISAVAATERIFEILGTPSEFDISKSKNNEASQLKIVGDISFQKIEFAYPTRKDMQVLKGINIDIKAGQKIALVGQSGSGKSTIVQLLLKFYNPSSGQIILDNKNINDLDLTAFRQNIGIVPQEVILFGGTIRENISYGKPLATEEEIIMAATQSNSWEFIDSFPDGLDTIVGERGIKLSGGQRQRIALARAFYGNPKLVILDEPNANLDEAGENALAAALLEAKKNNISVIVISHRPSILSVVDKILIVQDGKVSAYGTKEEIYGRVETLGTGIMHINDANKNTKAGN